MTDNTFTRVDPLMVHDALLYGPHRQDAADHVCAALRAAYAEIDRLRASALEWVTVTDDPKTLPEDGDTVLVRRSNSWLEFAKHNRRTNSWVMKSPVHNTPELTTYIVPGDRWAYIPEAPNANN